MRRQLLPALGMMIVFTVLTGLLYPMVVFGIAKAGWSDKADGSLITSNGKVVGSALIGQSFSKPEYFHPRPAADDYVAGAEGGGGTYSYGSNYGPTNDNYLLGEDDPTTKSVDESKTIGVDDRVRAYREENGLAKDAKVPVDAVTSSGSGLDPQISVANARIQAAVLAKERGVPVAEVLKLVDDNTDQRDLGFLGEPGVNVLELNLALDKL